MGDEQGVEKRPGFTEGASALRPICDDCDRTMAPHPAGWLCDCCGWVMRSDRPWRCVPGVSGLDAKG